MDLGIDGQRRVLELLRASLYNEYFRRNKPCDQGAQMAGLRLQRHGVLRSQNYAEMLVLELQILLESNQLVIHWQQKEERDLATI